MPVFLKFKNVKEGEQNKADTFATFYTLILN